ncbi:site-specific DNA-methyltransferase [Lapidilactobacillus achengensis]|uniref:Methyltransferase n=1 Tax=Lapidilactobacillus achengensis TaxID=2486000 RepID=A0ABW1UMK2_9LACO|nr:site-specific DNA-methyltransferase [Lapidilactobacillus achengensis]
MLIETKSIHELKNAEYNPRVELKPGMPEFEKLKSSIDTFGLVDPPIWNKQTGHLVGGHQRVAVAKLLGMTKLDVSVVDLSLVKEKQLNLALNKISGEWDEDKLAQLLDDLGDEVEITGFDEDEVSDLIQAMEHKDDQAVDVVEDDFDVNSFLKDDQEPTAKLGQIWKLGRHYLMCGDSTDKDSVSKLMQGHQADLIITDPPYNVAVESHSKELQDSGRDIILNDKLASNDFNSFLDQVFARYQEISKDTTPVYVFHSATYQREFENAMNKNGIVVRAQCIWVKNNATFGWAQYRWQHEPCFYAYFDGKSPSWYGDRKQTTVWRDELVEDISTVWEVSRDNTNEYMHPTQKPISLIKIPMVNSSKRDDIIVDLFGGSGSTLITAEQLKRSCYTMELDPKFCDVILNRFEKLTGIKSELLEH